MNYNEMPMPALRELGYALEPLVGREVRSTSKDELAAEVERAIDEAGDEAAEIAAEHLAAAEKEKAAEDSAAEATADAASEPESDSKPEAKANEPTTPAQRRRSRPKRQTIDKLPADARAPFYLVQCHPGDLAPGLYYHDVVVNPDAETKELVTKRLLYTPLNREQAAEMVRDGRARVAANFSRLPEG